MRVGTPRLSSCRAAEADVAFFELVPVVGDFIEDLVDFVDEHVLPDLALHALAQMPTPVAASGYPILAAVDVPPIMIFSTLLSLQIKTRPLLSSS